MSNGDTGQKVDSKFDYKESIFSESGFLNYVIRYGGGGGEQDLSPAQRVRADNPTTAIQPREFFPIRNFVLAQADRSPDAEKFKKKIVNFTGDTFSRSETFNGITAEDIAEIKKIEQAIKCPADMTAIASVSLHKPGNPKPFCNNIQAFKPHADNVIMTVESIDLEVTTDPKVGAGTISVFQGKMNIRFKSADEDKKSTDILKVVANNPALNFIFALENEYEIHLQNLPKPAVRQDNKGLRGLANYDALTNPQLAMRFLTNTIKYDLVGWKPHVNEATFSITFAQSTTKRKVSTNPIPVKANATKAQLNLAAQARKAQRAIDANNLTEKIIRQLRENNSLFKYEFSKRTGSDTTEYLIEVDRANKTPQQIEAENSARTGAIKEKIERAISVRSGDFKPAIATSRTESITTTVGYRTAGGFFLFRSLIIATLQSFVPTFKSAGLTDKDIQNLLFFIDETEVPSEIGKNFGLRGALDVRCTLETVVVDFNVFTKFMDDLYASSADITMDYFFQRLFSDLLKRAITASRSKTYAPGDPQRLYTTFPTIGNDKFTTFGNDFQEKNIRDSVGDGYKCFTINILKDVIDCALKDNKLSGLKNIYTVRNQDRTPDVQPLPTNIVNQAGSLEIKTVNEQVVRKAVDKRAGAPQDKLTFAIFIDKIGAATPSLGERQTIVSFKQTPAKLREQGIIVLQPFRQKDEIFNNRIVTEGVQTPFKFTKIDNKDIDTDRRLNAGIKSIIRNIYSVSFSLKSVLGIRPYKNRFLFYPSFFYGGQGKGNIKDDAFGFAGVYTCNSVNVSLSPGANSFVTSISAYFENEILSPKQAQLARAKAKGKKTAADSKSVTGTTPYIDKLTKRRERNDKSISELKGIVGKLETKKNKGGFFGGLSTKEEEILKLAKKTLPDLKNTQRLLNKQLTEALAGLEG